MIKTKRKAIWQTRNPNCLIDIFLPKSTELPNYESAAKPISRQMLACIYRVENRAGESRVVKSNHPTATSPSSAGRLKDFYLRWSDLRFVTVKVVGIWKNRHAIRLYKVHLERPPIMSIVHYATG